MIGRTMMLNALLALVAALVLAGVAVASTASPPFQNGPLVARKMEQHYNGATYKARLAREGGKIVRRILCAYDDVVQVVECTGRLRVKGVAVKAEWDLVKRTNRRAKLTWTFTGKGVFQYDSEIVAPRAFGLTRF